MTDSVIGQSTANPKAEVWVEHIAAQQRSGISVKQFCKERGLTEYSFYAWRKRLREKGLVRFALRGFTPFNSENDKSGGLDSPLPSYMIKDVIIYETWTGD